MLHLKPGPIAAQYPIRLVGAAGGFEGDHHITLSGSLPRGRYRLTARVAEAVHNQLMVVRLNGRIIDSLAIPFGGDPDDNWADSRRDRVTGEKLDFVNDVKTRYNVADLYRKRLAERGQWTFVTDFVVDRAGEQSITLSNENEDDSGPAVRFYHGDGIELLALEVAAGNTPAPSSFARRLPGLPMLDAWGWMAYLDFDNPSRREATFDEVASGAIVQARRHGANLLELNPSLRDGHCFDFDRDGGPVEGTVESTCTAWTTDKLRELFRLAHEHGMLVELFIFSIVGFHSFYSMTPEQIMTFLERVHKLLGCRGTYPETLAAIDGAVYELFPHDGPRETDDAWRHNPGAVQAVSGGITGTAMELTGIGYSAGFANYTAHWVGSPVQHTGYDALFQAAPYPAAFYRRPQAVGTCYLQGSAERRRPAEGAMVRDGYLQTGFPGRDASHDWILAQLQGFARRRWLDQDDPAASVVCWEAVADEIAPPETKRLVYAATSDPIRSVVTGTLADTGRAGTIDFRRTMRRSDTANRVRLEPRHEMPAEARFLRNQDLELVSFPGKDYNVLMLDASRCAQFYGSGQVLRAFQPLWVTLSPDAAVTGVDEHYRVTRVGGSMGEIEQRVTIHRAECVINETRRMRMLTDRPGVELTVHRHVEGTDGGPVTVLQGSAPNPAYAMEVAEQTDRVATLKLTDPDGVLPEARMRIAVEGATLDELTAEKVVRLATAVTGSMTLRVRLAFAAGHISAERLPEMVADDGAWEVPTVELPPDGSEVELPVRTTFDDTRVVAVKPSIDGPCRVAEDGWWHYRGVSPDDDHPSRDYLTVHCRAGQVVRAARDSMIGGHLTWGWGSQYIMVLSDVTERDGWVRVDALVDRVTPYVFAPRITLRETPSEIALDGKPWHYADGNTVFLPNRPGRYTLSFRYGAPAEPRICRTMAVVEQTRWDGTTLTVKTALPPWCAEDPGHHGWYALVDDGKRRTVRRIEIGENRLGS